LSHGSHKIRPERPRFYDQNMDSQRLDLLCERFRKAFDREFCSRIIARAGIADDATDGCDIDDIS
jgi:hypothetical protein